MKHESHLVTCPILYPALVQSDFSTEGDTCHGIIHHNCLKPEKLKSGFPPSWRGLAFSLLFAQRGPATENWEFDLPMCGE